MAHSAVIEIRAADIDAIREWVARADAEIARLRAGLRDIADHRHDRDCWDGCSVQAECAADVLAVEWIP